MKNKTLTKRNPEWHAEARDLLQKNFNAIHTAFLDATKRAVWLGLFLNYIKARGKEDRSIPHGQFGPWLKANVPDLSRDTITTYMTIGAHVTMRSKLNLPKYGKSVICLQGELPASVLPLIEGKTQSQLFLEYKQARVEDFIATPKRGNLSGKGCTRDHRANAAILEEEARVQKINLESEEFAKWIMDHADEKGFGSLTPENWKSLKKAFQTGLAFMQSIEDTQKKGQA